MEVGDRVLLKNVVTGGPGKLRSFWERKIYVVIWKDDMVPVYTVRGLGEKKTKTVHRNMMMKVNDLPLDIFEQDAEPTSQQKPRTRVVTFEDDTSSEDSEPEAVCVETSQDSFLEGEEAVGIESFDDDSQ